MINLQNVSKSFGLTFVLNDINLKISTGQFTTIIGPNGSGKTTLLRIISGLLTPNTGTVTINGINTATHAYDTRHLIGVISHQSFLYENLTAFENLLFYARLYGINDINSRIKFVLDTVNLSKHQNILISTFSHGMKQKLSIARSILHNPPIILCDEPYTGLDQNSSDNLTRLLQSITYSGNTVVMVTHNLNKVIKLSDQLIVLHKGKIETNEPIADKTLETLIKEYDEITTR
ncbi:MAG TPA: heme ABC exporter ATP-binding protein CcmA [Chloroflexi bacterium]|nr:heme ABC exporter ATP-binding protein CcmA [Chloroflexota bacterium]|tara:strand:+ start:2099 stop:2797 length:699 start_codon:yes stop_codon:yes gene_type:complete